MSAEAASSDKSASHSNSLSAEANAFQPAIDEDPSRTASAPASASNLWGAIGQTLSFHGNLTRHSDSDAAIRSSHSANSHYHHSNSNPTDFAASASNYPVKGRLAEYHRNLANTNSSAMPALEEALGPNSPNINVWSFGGFDVDALTAEGNNKPHSNFHSARVVSGSATSMASFGPHSYTSPLESDLGPGKSGYDRAHASSGRRLLTHLENSASRDMTHLTSAFGSMVTFGTSAAPLIEGENVGTTERASSMGYTAEPRSDANTGSFLKDSYSSSSLYAPSLLGRNGLVPSNNARITMGPMTGTAMAGRGNLVGKDMGYSNMYHQGQPMLSQQQPPGWETIPRWIPGSYGAAGGVGIYGGQGYSGTGVVGGLPNSRVSISPYPPPDMNDYGPPLHSHYAPPHQGYTAHPGNYRSMPSFVPSPTPPIHYGIQQQQGVNNPRSNNNNNNNNNNNQGNVVPTGPYPPSFQPVGSTSSSSSSQNPPALHYETRNNTDGYGDSTGSLETLSGVGGGGAFSSILQAPYNPQLSAQQRKYPPILGGAPSPVLSEGLFGSDSGGKPPIRKSMGFRGVDSNNSINSNNPLSTNKNFIKGQESSAPTVASSSTSSMINGEISPTPSTLSDANLGIQGPSSVTPTMDQPILPRRMIPEPCSSPASDEDNDLFRGIISGVPIPAPHDSTAKKREWLLNMNHTLESTPVGELNPNTLPISTIMNGWAKQKSSEGARMVEMWLDRVHSEYNAENAHGVHPTARMYTMAVDAWAKSGGGAPAARRAEALLERMDRLYREGGERHEALKPSTGIFNAVINAWARSREKIAPARAEQILAWMEKLREQGGEDLDISPDKYTFNTVIHAYAKSGAKEAAAKAHRILDNMNQMYREGNSSVKPDTITYNVVINAYAKSGGKGAAQEAEHLLQRMHMMYDQGDLSVKPNVVTYGAVIDAFAKSLDRNAAARADALLANMVALHQSDPVRHADLRPNTYVFNTVINAWAKSKERGAAAKAEEMLVAMDRLHASGFPGLKPDAFTYTAVIDAYAKSGYRGAASRADLLLDQMEAKYAAGDNDLKPNTFTYNAVINALAKSGEPGAAARAERVLHNMVNRLRANGGNDVKPTTINFNTVLDAWAKSGEGEAAAERAEAILEWMDRLNKAGNTDVKPDTITFNAVIDAWARSGSKRGPYRAEQILNHMDELCQGGNLDVKPDTYTYNTLINALAKSGDGGSAARAEEVLAIMEQRYHAGDKSFKPNTRSHTSVIDAWAKSGEAGAARRAEHILENLKSLYETTGDIDIKPNVYTANAVMNACAFSKHETDRIEALEMAFRTFAWLDAQKDIRPDAYTFTIMLSVCANLIGKEDSVLKFDHARMLFENCCQAGHVNDHVLWKLKLTVSESEYVQLVGYGMETKAADLPSSWSRSLKGKSAGENRNNNNWPRNRGKRNPM